MPGPRTNRYNISDVFFFQAEDGIRDAPVTGVQTCALPIWRSPAVIAGESGAILTGTLPANPTSRRSSRGIPNSTPALVEMIPMIFDSQVTVAFWIFGTPASSFSPA